MFFVHLLPIDANYLPHSRQPYGLDNLDFKFNLHGEMLDGKCIAVRDLPEYDIAWIRVGQYEGDNGIWTEGISLP